MLSCPKAIAVTLISEYDCCSLQDHAHSFLVDLSAASKQLCGRNAAKHEIVETNTWGCVHWNAVTPRCAPMCHQYGMFDICKCVLVNLVSCLRWESCEEAETSPWRRSAGTWVGMHRGGDIEVAPFLIRSKEYF